MNMSHHRFPLYHHWSISFTDFFFPLLFALFSLFYRRGSGCGSGLWLWFSIVGLVVGLVVISNCDRRGRRSLGCGSSLWVSPLCSISQWTDRALSSHQRVGSLNQFLEQELCEWTSGFVKEALVKSVHENHDRNSSLVLLCLGNTISSIHHTGKFSVFFVILLVFQCLLLILSIFLVHMCCLLCYEFVLPNHTSYIFMYLVFSPDQV